MPSYRVELHSHCQGDPVDTNLSHTLFQHIDRAKEVGLDAIAVTWHRKVCAVPEAYAYARERGVLLISGMEAEVNRRHVVVLNLADGDLPGEPTWNQLQALRRRKPEVLVLAPHPFYPHPCCLGNTINDHPDCIDAVEWCMLHVDWLPGRVNPNLRAARWAQRHGKPMVACSDAHSLTTIGKNASMVEADELTPGAIMAGLRSGRVSFHRQSLKFGPLLVHSAIAMASQPRHIKRWVKAKWPGRRAYPAGTSSAPGFEVLP
ncbi:MAG: PHP domain-containing protein [Methylacidiphilales bacterium]|nr:PHP domain-containing protein [Candidatus Methylacidiphilales bacterium]